MPCDGIHFCVNLIPTSCLSVRLFVECIWILYMKFSSQYPQQLLITDAWNFNTLFLLAYVIWWDSFLCESDTDFLFFHLSVCRVYMKFSSQFPQQLLIADAWKFSTLFLLACSTIGIIFVWMGCQLLVYLCICPKSVHMKYCVYEIFVAVFSATTHRRCLKF
jgi:hypothetical protein